MVMRSVVLCACGCERAAWCGGGGGQAGTRRPLPTPLFRGRQLSHLRGTSVMQVLFPQLLAATNTQSLT